MRPSRQAMVSHKSHSYASATYDPLVYRGKGFLVWNLNEASGDVNDAGGTSARDATLMFLMDCPSLRPFARGSSRCMTLPPRLALSPLSTLFFPSLQTVAVSLY